MAAADEERRQAGIDAAAPSSSKDPIFPAWHRDAVNPAKFVYTKDGQYVTEHDIANEDPALRTNSPNAERAKLQPTSSRKANVSAEG